MNGPQDQTHEPATRQPHALSAGFIEYGLSDGDVAEADSIGGSTTRKGLSAPYSTTH
jgi:hypothetical protein